MPDQRIAQDDGRLAFARFAAWLCLVVPAAVAALILIQGGPLFRLAGPGVFMLTGLAVRGLLHRGRHEAAFRALTYGSWLAALVALSYTGGLQGNAAAVLPLIVVFSAWLAGIRAMLFLGGATIAALFGYALLDLYDLLPARFHPPVLQRAFIHAMIVVAATALGYYAARTLSAQLNALRASRHELKNKVAALARRERELDLLAENVPAMIAHIGADGLCRYANSAYARFHGQSPESIVGMPARDIVGAQAYADIEADIRRALGGEPASRSVTRLNAEGEPRSLALELVPDRSDNGEVAGWYALIRDITERERAARALRHIIDGTARATGSAFFQALALNLAQATGLDRAMVAEILPDGRHARALALWDGRECRQGMKYLLADAPCQQVIERGEACFADGVAERFPRDAALAMNGIRSYYGVRLESRQGTPLGVLVVMDTAPIRDRSAVASLVTIFAARAAAELERLHAEEERHAALARFEAIFHNTPNVAIQGFDARGTVLHWNRASERLYGIPAAAAIGHPIQSLLFDTPEARRAFETQVAALCASGRPAGPGEWPIALRDGREIHVLSTMFPLRPEGGIDEIFCMDVDITELKQANESVRRLNAELETRVAERTAQLAELNRELEAFSYTVSHDLRAPLRSIEGFGRLLEQDYAGRLDATGLDYLDRMTRAARRLALLIDDLLELTRIDRVELRPADVDLGTLAGEIVEELRQGAPQRCVEVDIAPGLSARGDPRLLRIALQNLLENAWKYTAATPGARIVFGCEDTAGQRIHHVRDNGAGFDMAYAGKLFQPFQRLHGPHEFEGHGVGLASVYRVIKRHGGRVWAEGAVGQGATFYFTLAPQTAERIPDRP